MKEYINKIKKNQNLSFDESKAAFKILMEGKANDQEILDFLTFLSTKGEASDEIAGGVYVLRDKAKRVNVDSCIDTCGTGGGGNYNVAGKANTGGGGGGGHSNSNSVTQGKPGGSGLVVMRYPTSGGTITVGSGLTSTTTTSGSDTIVTFTAGTGTISFT